MSRTLKMIFASFLLAGLALMGMAPTQAKQDKIKPEAELTSATPLSPSDKKHLLEDNFVLVKTVTAIPRLVRKKILGKGIEAGMADAGQPYQDTDIIIAPKFLPNRRLIFAGTAQGYCFVYNEHGGFVPGQEILLYRLSLRQALLVWQCDLRNEKRYLNLRELRSAVNRFRLFPPQLSGQAQVH